MFNDHAEIFFLNFSVANMAGNETSNNDLIYFSSFLKHDKGMNGVSNHHLKLQSKKFSRTRDIPNFPTQG